MNSEKKQFIPRAEIGVIGGSGFYDLLEKEQEVEVATPFGAPSDKVRLGRVVGHRVAFLPRHGQGHKIPPHKIPFKANLFALKKMGVKQIISPAAVGSLNPLIKPGDFVICNQFINWTKKREDTFYNGQEIEGLKKSGRVVHVSLADPYCPELRRLANRCCQKLNIPHHETGTVVVIDGPRFSTRAESRLFASQGGDIINMTIYPEVVLARELGMCYVNIGLVTDYDVGLIGHKNIKPVTIKEVLKIFNENNQKVKDLIFEIIKNLPQERKCGCEKFIDEAVV